jgi:hypothetical protein
MIVQQLAAAAKAVGRSSVCFQLKNAKVASHHLLLAGPFAKGTATFETRPEEVPLVTQDVMQYLATKKVNVYEYSLCLTHFHAVHPFARISLEPTQPAWSLTEAPFSLWITTLKVATTSGCRRAWHSYVPTALISGMVISAL